MTGTIEVVFDDITKLPVVAIVNAANEQLAPGGAGTNAAIHRAAGPQLALECHRVAPCPTGSAKLTSGYNLPAEHVIHTVGPVWRGGMVGEEDTLASCYRAVLSLAKHHGINEIAFPAISTGVFGFPVERAAQIAISTVQDAVEGDDFWGRIVFCLFDVNNARAFRELLGRSDNISSANSQSLPERRGG